MSREIKVSETVRLRVGVEALWDFLGDTDRLNRALGLPAIKFEPDLTKKGHYRAETQYLGMALKYEEFPFDWVRGQYHKVLRRFERGPFESIEVGMRLRPKSEGTELEVFSMVVPRGVLGDLLARTLLKRMAARDLIRLCREFDKSERDSQARRPGAPPVSLVNEAQLEARLRALRGFPVERGLVEALERHLRWASDLEVVQMRPFELADRWGAERMAALGLMLYAAKAGLVDLGWHVLCPNCRAPSADAASLGQLKAEAHCATCEIDFKSDFAACVEARFSVNPGVRRARRAIYCIGGPANQPQVLAQLRLEPGEERDEELNLAPGGYRLHCYQEREITPLRSAEGAKASALDIDIGGGALAASTAEVRPGPLRLRVKNRLSGEALLVLERESWQESAATAARVTSLQDFRDLFPNEAVAPGEEIGVSSLALLFSDLKSSTSLYQKIGDPRAFSFVQSHFRFLVGAIARHHGGVVKTMGDAVMASFAGSRDALAAAVEMQKGWMSFCAERRAEPGLELKIGVHLGPSIAINNRGRLDYFGTTVNTAARIQAQSKGGDIVCSAAAARDCEAGEFLKGLDWHKEEFSAVLRGIEGEQKLLRIKPS